MRVLFVSSTYSNYYAIDPVVRELLSRGHEARLIAGMEKKQTVADDALRKALADLPGLTARPLSKRRVWRGAVRNLREVLNYAHVLNNEENRRWDVSKWDRFIPPWLWRFINTPKIRQKIKDPQTQRLLRAFERKIPVSAHIRREIIKNDPDVAVLMPLINPNSLETEYLRAAQALGIPTVYSMVSWDNISSKGTFHGRPDYSIVWNEPLADELADIHDISRDSVLVVGAPRFAYLFDQKNINLFSRGSFCAQAGLNPQKPYILYVCSTFLVNNEHKKDIDESKLILEIAGALLKDRRTTHVNILVRPHPVNPSFISKLTSAEAPNVTVYPSPGEIPDTEDKRIRYYSAISHSIAAVGVNTTAFLEAAALDKPCITIRSEQFSETQQLPHFHHLSDGRFLETARGAEGAVDCIAEILNGVDRYAVERRAFSKNFLRPCEKPAPQAYVDALEDIVEKRI